MKKAISILTIMVFMVGMLSVTAFAHGGHRYASRTRQQPQYQLCAVNGCDLAGIHQHDGAWYCSQTVSQVNYEICTVRGCTQLGLHEHNGAYYYCADHGPGHGHGRWQTR